MDETNLQAAFDKLIFVELAIFVDIKLVEHHLRILLCSVLEKCKAVRGVQLRVGLHPSGHYVEDQLVLRKSDITLFETR